MGGRPLMGTLDTAALGAEEAASAEHALRALPYGRPVPPPPTRPEMMRYEFTVVDDAGQTRRAAVNEDELPDALRRLIDPTLHVDTPPG